MSISVPNTEDYRYNSMVELAVINCGVCGGTYAINERRRSWCQENAKGWFCPYCKNNWGYFGKTEAQRLRDQLAEERQRRQHAQQNARLADERAEHERRRALGYKGQMARTKKRIGNGVCPCCNRTFKDLQQHMTTKHPEYAQ